MNRAPSNVAPLLCLVAGVVLAVALALAPTPAGAAVRRVPQDFARVSDALAAALPGDSIAVAAGTYSPSTNGESFPLVVATNSLTLHGAGMGLSVLDAEGTGTVVELAAPGARLSDFTITGGRAAWGGGVRVTAGAPEIARNLVLANGASDRGAGIHVDENRAAWIHHNVVWQSYDTDPAAGGDPHGIQLTGANGTVEHNLVGRGDSNGLLNSGANSAPLVRNNIFFENGTPGVRGRGFCALGDSNTVIAHNLFWGNAVAAIVQIRGGLPVDMSGGEANDLRPDDGIYGNLDADPLLADPDGLDFALLGGSPAVDAGAPGSPPDPDGTPADLGPFYLDQSAVAAGDGPGPAGVALAAAPNPFAGATRLRFELARPGHVHLAVHDARGARVAVLADGRRPAGAHVLTWGGTDVRGRRVASGIYFARLSVEGGIRCQKLLLAR
jgi:hypothetical protein